MSDRLLDFTQSSFGKQIAGLIGIPSPPRLRRAKTAYVHQALADRSVLLGGSAQAELSAPLVAALDAMAATLVVSTELPGLAPIKQAAASQRVNLKTEAPGEGKPVHAYVFDASGIDSTAGLRQLYDFLQPRLSRLAAHGRIVIVSRAAPATDSLGGYTCAMALRGFTKSLGKEIGKKGATVNLVEVGAGTEAALEGALRFFLTEHSAFVDAQILILDAPASAAQPSSIVAPLRGKLAVVTGAARGIGAAIAETLAREGADVVGVDRPQEEGALGATMSRIGGRGLALDVTAADAGERLAAEMAQRGGAINAVAPGFIETQMTASMPTIPREFGRRLSSLNQGGLPIDIAEAVTFLASPLAAGVNGRTLRVCGQNYMGA